jgi:predicted dehydrogenase
MGPLRAAVIGSGAVARDQHVPILAELQGVELIALCDRNAPRAEELARQHGVPRSFTDAGALLAECELDFVHILTPPESHRELAERALGAGCHVLVEKPFVYSVEEADVVLAAAKAAEREVSVIHNELFLPAVDELHQRVAAGEIGDVCGVHFFDGRRDQTFVPDAWYFRTRGGRLGETLPHAIYQLTEFFDDLEVEHVSARRLGHIVKPSDLESEEHGFDELHVDLWSPRRSALATLTYSFNTNLDKWLLVAGTRGSLSAFVYGGVRLHESGGRGLRQLVRESSAEWRAALERAWRRRFVKQTAREELREGTHYRQIAEFVGSLAAGRSPRVDVVKAREVVRLWELIVARMLG